MQHTYVCSENCVGQVINHAYAGFLGYSGGQGALLASSCLGIIRYLSSRFYCIVELVSAYSEMLSLA